MNCSASKITDAEKFSFKCISSCSSVRTAAKAEADTKAAADKAAADAKAAADKAAVDANAATVAKAKADVEAAAAKASDLAKAKADNAAAEAKAKADQDATDPRAAAQAKAAADRAAEQKRLDELAKAKAAKAAADAKAAAEKAAGGKAEADAGHAAKAAADKAAGVLPYFIPLITEEQIPEFQTNLGEPTEFASETWMTESSTEKHIVVNAHSTKRPSASDVGQKYHGSRLGEGSETPVQETYNLDGKGKVCKAVLNPIVEILKPKYEKDLNKIRALTDKISVTGVLDEDSKKKLDGLKQKVSKDVRHIIDWFPTNTLSGCVLGTRPRGKKFCDKEEKQRTTKRQLGDIKRYVTHAHKIFSEEKYETKTAAGKVPTVDYLFRSKELVPKKLRELLWRDTINPAINSLFEEKSTCSAAKGPKCNCLGFDRCQMPSPCFMTLTNLVNESRNSKHISDL